MCNFVTFFQINEVLTSLVVLFSYQIKFNISTSKTVTKIKEVILRF